MKTLRKLIPALLILSIAFVSSCRKDRDDLNDTTSASDNEQGEAFSNDVMNIADNAAKTGSAGFRTSEATEVFDGLIARVIQHEYDHIEGILFTDLISSLKKQLIKKKLQNIMDGKARPDYRMKFCNKKGR